MGENSTTWMNTAVLVTCLRNFGWRNDSPVSGILKSYAGLSKAILTDICTALFAGDPSKFLFMLAVVPFVICLTAVFFLREIPSATTVAEKWEETMYFTVFKAITIVVAVYLLGHDFVKTTGDAVSVAFAVVLARATSFSVADSVLLLLDDPDFDPVETGCRGSNCGAPVESGTGSIKHNSCSK
ncbi:hypothetical protein LWI29_007693 [Acer saccharum]|uniref:Nodulin-like domain-containing protein n=1 Tax=Acer saccharum TaxID=4024 RepID=A0AA39VBB7_ACESA|nr:hypothetical protein LWI29_007693 [Acer saccharum]